MKREHLISLCLIAILCVGFFLRVYKLSQIPGSLNPDETSLGYTAFSFLKTGTDEHGKVLPLALESFGDWKLPVYPLAAILPVAFFGLTEFAIRLPSALAGTLCVYLMYLIALSLFQKKSIGLFAALFIAFSPWSIYFSHAAYEDNLAMAFLLGGVYLYLRYIRENQKNIALALSGTLCLGITLFTYHSYILFVPLFFMGMLLLVRKQLKFNQGFFVSLGVFIIFIIASYISTTTSSADKVSTLFIFNDQNVIYNRVEKLRGDGAAKNELTEKILHNKYFGGTYQIAQNYLLSFSPSFLFDKGGEKLEHNLYGIGNLYLFDAFLLFIGMISLFWYREKTIPFILVWLILAPIPSALTKDAPNSTRLYLLLPPLLFIASYGAQSILSFLQKKRNLLPIAVVLLALYLFNVSYFLDAYFTHFNTQRVRFWHYGYKQAVELTNKYPDYHVVMRGPENFPYIYFLFYNAYDPKRFQKEVSYYPRTSEGFLYVRHFGRFDFVKKIDYDHLSHKTIYIDDTGLGDPNHAILLPTGEPILGYTIIP